MIKSLRRRFIAAAMLSVVIVLALLLAAVTAVGFFAMENASDRTLELLSSMQDAPPAFDSEGGSMPDGQAAPFLGGEAPPLPPSGGKENSDISGALFGYQLRPESSALNYFIVEQDATGELLITDVSPAPLVDESAAQSYFAEAVAGDRTGKLNSYKYMVTDRQDGGIRVIFLDVTLQLRTLTDTIGATALVFLGCLAVMLLVVVIVSGRAVRPIADNIERQRRFVTDAGHEIKTPLAIILANTDALELHNGQSKWSVNIRDSAERLSELMKRLLSLSRMDEGRTVCPMEEFELSGLVRRVTASFEESAALKSVTIVTDIADSIKMSGDAGSLTELVTVLVDNAVKYTDEGGRISISLSRCGRNAVLETVNSCSALPDAPAERLFERFYRSDASRSRESGGFGVGLSVARAAAELHSGRLSAHYDDAHTIRFHAELPIS